MKWYWIIDAVTGTLLKKVMFTSLDDLNANTGPGELVCPAVEGEGQNTHRWNGTAIASFIFVPTITQARSNKLTELDNARDAYAFGGVVTPWGHLQTDADSKANSTGAALLALIRKMGNESFSINWTMTDNSLVTLDADGMIGLASMIAQHVNTAFIKGRSLKDQVLMAGTVAAVEAVTWGSV